MAKIMDLITEYLKKNHEATWQQIIDYCRSSNEDAQMVAEEIMNMMTNGWIRRKTNRATGTFYYKLNKR